MLTACRACPCKHSSVQFHFQKNNAAQNLKREISSNTASKHDSLLNYYFISKKETIHTITHPVTNSTLQAWVATLKMELYLHWGSSLRVDNSIDGSWCSTGLGGMGLRSTCSRKTQAVQGLGSRNALGKEERDERFICGNPKQPQFYFSFQLRILHCCSGFLAEL